jgi:hypothetical protein
MAYVKIARPLATNNAKLLLILTPNLGSGFQIGELVSLPRNKEEPFICPHAHLTVFCHSKEKELEGR